MIFDSGLLFGATLDSVVDNGNVSWIHWRLLFACRKGIYRRFSKCDWDQAYEATTTHANTKRRLAELMRADVWGAIRIADRAINRQCSNSKKLGLYTQ